MHPQLANSTLRTAIKRLRFPLGVMLVCVRWYAAYSLSQRNLEEMMAERGVLVDHANFHRRALKALPMLATVFQRRKLPVGRALKGHARTRNSCADIFLASLDGRYIGRTCGWRECWPGIRVACRAMHCAEVPFLNDDPQVVSLAPTLISAPPINLWPQVVRRIDVPADVEQWQLEPLSVKHP